MAGSDAFPPPMPRVDDRVIELLSERSGRIAFGGLRRALGVHPESLTRALRRLEREGVIRRFDGGYELADAPGRQGEPPLAVRTRPLASVELPPGATREEVFGRLSGRWFGALRWVGVFEHPGDPWLVWSVEGVRGHIVLSVKEGYLRVMVEGTAPEGASLDDASYELLGHALSVLRLRGRPRDLPPGVARLSASPVSRFGEPN